MERKARLAAAAGAGQGHEPVPPYERLDLR
jgi:hypothetical protein